MLTSSLRKSTRGQALHSRATVALVLRPTCASLIRHRQQTRAFRLGWGWWDSDVDSESHREMRRRSRMLRHKYTESLNRKPSWEKHPRAEDAKRAFRRMSGHYYDPTTARWCGKSINVNWTRTPDKMRSTRAGQNIEDVERGAMDHLLFGDMAKNASKDFDYRYDHWFTPLQNIRNYVAHRQETMKDYVLNIDATASSALGRTNAVSNTTSNSQEPTSFEEEYVIDPITNRKVPKLPSKLMSDDGVSRPARTSIKYRSWFSQFEAPKVESTQTSMFDDGPTPTAELRRHELVDTSKTSDATESTQVEFDPPASPAELANYSQVETDAVGSEPVGFPSTISANGADTTWAPSPSELRQYSQVDLDRADWAADKAAATQFKMPESELPLSDAEMRKYQQVSRDETPADNAGHDHMQHLSPTRTRKTDSTSVPNQEVRGSIRSQDPAPLDIADGGDANYLSWKYAGVFWQKGNEPLAQEDPALPTGHRRFRFSSWEPVPEKSTVQEMTNEASKVLEDFPLTPQELEKYKPFRYNEPDGKPPGSTVEEIPGDLHLYKAFRFNEPDGKSPGVTEVSRLDPKEPHKHKAVRMTEPDGQIPVTEEQVVDSEELRGYEPVKHSEPHDRGAAVEEVIDLDELRWYKAVRHSEPDGQADAPVDAVPEADELRGYTQVKHNEPDGQRAVVKEVEVDSAELRECQPVEDNEPDGQSCEAASETTDAFEKGKHETGTWDDSRTTPTVLEDEGGLLEYRTARHGEPNQSVKYDADTVTGLEDFDASKDNSWILGESAAPMPPAEKEGTTISERLLRFTADIAEAERRTNGGRGSAAGYSGNTAVPEQPFETSKRRTSLESLMDRLQTASDAADRDAAAAVRSMKQNRLRDDKLSSLVSDLSGNFVRDFPEEFATSWNGSADSGLLPKQSVENMTATSTVDGEIRSRIQKNEREFADAVAAGQNFSKPQSALDRQQQPSKTMSAEARWKATAYPYSDEPKGLEESNTEAFVIPAEAATRSTVTQPEPASAQVTEPMVYKILAYDPTMQTINTAETTSVVPDTAAALTPAEVLLRLSNPAKFFPHFAPLQAQGFEIVSGSGDVLVFRKVHPAGAALPADARHEAAPPAVTHAAVNPIDMTGTRTMSPPAANFASPTGYVHYGMPAADGEALPPPPDAPRFQSNIDVRREEPVFSGAKAGGRGAKAGGRAEKGGRKGLGRRMLVAATWVAGVSYALGVVGEYFKTGGADGFGPKGF